MRKIIKGSPLWIKKDLSNMIKNLKRAKSFVLSQDKWNYKKDKTMNEKLKQKEKEIEIDVGDLVFGINNGITYPCDALRQYRECLERFLKPFGNRLDLFHDGGKRLELFLPNLD